MTPEEPETSPTNAGTSGPPSGPPPPPAPGPGASASATPPASAPDASERLATQIETDVHEALPWRSIAKRSVAVVVFGVTIYLVFPSLVAVFSSFPKLTSLDPIWFTLALAFEVASFVCTIALQRIALRTKAWFSVSTSQLAGNAISLVVPGGAAVGAATQFRMLAKAGNDTTTTVGGLTAFSLLNIAGLLGLPIFVLPAILAGTPIARGLLTTALLGLGAFVLFTGFAVAVLLLDGPIRWIGRVVQAARNRWRRKAEPMSDLPERLVRERNSIRDVLGQRWKEAALLSSGRLFLDYGCLLASIRATGARPNPSLVLLA
ncbi:MAG TPA: TIGR00374 family protein, partial [Candidatus Dormibacteraeota bacterium]